MTTKEWLQRGWKLDKEITALLRLKADARDRAIHITPSYEGSGVQSAPDPHKFDRLVELESLIDERVDELCRIRGEILRAIALVPDARYRTLLIERYTEFKPWEQIAVDMNYSFRQITRMHGEAILQVRQIVERMS